MVRASCHERGPRPRLRGFLVVARLASACSAPPGKVGPAHAGPPLRGLTPAGPVHSPVTFSWEGNSADGVVRVSVEDRAQRPVFSFPARGSKVTAPGGLAEVLTPGEPFTWTVAVLDQNDETSRTSAPVSFTPE